MGHSSLLAINSPVVIIPLFAARFTSVFYLEGVLTTIIPPREARYCGNCGTSLTSLHSAITGMTWGSGISNARLSLG